MSSSAASAFERVYAHVDDIDVFSGGLAERPVVGGLVGPTFACIIGQQFLNLRRGDRFWYERSLVTLTKVRCSLYISVTRGIHHSFLPFFTGYFCCNYELHRNTETSSCVNSEELTAFDAAITVK